MKDFYATLKIQQGRIRRAMLELGIKNAAELARQSGLSQCEIGRLLNFKTSPKRKKNGEWRVSVLKIFKALSSMPEELFPEHLDYEILTNEISDFVEHAQLSGTTQKQLCPSEECEQTELCDTIDEVLDTLQERERDVLKARIWEGKSLTEVGDMFGVSCQMVQYIEAKALRKLRHPDRLSKLEEAWTSVRTFKD